MTLTHVNIPIPRQRAHARPLINLLSSGPPDRPRPEGVHPPWPSGDVLKTLVVDSNLRWDVPPSLTELADQWRFLLRQPECGAEELFHQVQRIARALGFEHCAYGLRLPLPFTQRGFLAMNNYPPDWRARYVEKDYVARDPTVLLGARSAEPMVWSDALFSATPELWSEAQSFGLRFGWAQSCFDQAGRVGMLSVGRSQEPLTSAELAAHEFVLRWLVNITHTAIAPLLTKRAIAEVRTLTARERDVMSWMADGKTTPEAALILGISERTVKFHVMNVMTKLQVNNKTEAVVHAAVLGLLN